MKTKNILQDHTLEKGYLIVYFNKRFVQILQYFIKYILSIFQQKILGRNVYYS